ncbi:MAG: hypothetical protein K2Q09_02645 [Phycisphaerales bacterium]|nr:hypothetical protein [Phycisphaerales bacterium]
MKKTRPMLTSIVCSLLVGGAVFADCHQVEFTWKGYSNSGNCAAYTRCPESPVCMGGYASGLMNKNMTGNYTVICEEWVGGDSTPKGCVGGTYIGPSPQQKSFTNAPICSTTPCP